MAVLIALEGIDAAGKGTQAALLRKRADASGLRVAALSFPRYGETLYARTIEEYLAGRFGDLESVEPRFAALLFAGDRLESRALLLQLAATSDLLVLDRYTASNLAYQGARLAAAELRPFLDWISQVEHRVNGLPRPDLTVFLDVPVATASAAIAARDDRARADMHEASAGYLERVSAIYKLLAQEGQSWRAIACAASTGGMLPPVEIHERIWAELAPLLE